MIARKDASYLADIERLSLSIQKGNIKNIDKTEAKLKNHNKKHKIAAEKYNATILCSEEGKAQCIEGQQKLPSQTHFLAVMSLTAHTWSWMRWKSGN